MSEEIPRIGGQQSQLNLSASGRPRERNIDETDPAEQPRPCRYCGVTIPAPRVSCDADKCQEKLAQELSLDGRIRDRLDRQRDA